MQLDPTSRLGSPLAACQAMVVAAVPQNMNETSPGRIALADAGENWIARGGARRIASEPSPGSGANSAWAAPGGRAVA